MGFINLYLVIASNDPKKHMKATGSRTKQQSESSKVRNIWVFSPLFPSKRKKDDRSTGPNKRGGINKPK